MSHKNGLYIVLKDEKYQETVVRIVTQHTDLRGRRAYIPNSEYEIDFNADNRAEKDFYAVILDKAFLTDETSGKNRYSDVALNTCQASFDVIVTNSLENKPLELVDAKHGIPQNPYIMDSTDDGLYYPLDNLLNLSLRGKAIVIGVDAPDMNAAYRMVYDEANVLGKKILFTNYGFGDDVFGDEKFAYWARK